MPEFSKERIHFVGVGGAGMCALAEYCLLCGAEVSGSDIRENAAFRHLKEAGAEVYLGARRDIIARAGLVVRSSAVPLSDKEVSLALAMGKRVIERHELLALVAEDFDTVVAVSGTHGKTTVTAMTAHILAAGGVDFVAHIGGTPVGMGNLTVRGGGDGRLPRGIFLTEACEYARHMLALRPDVAAVVSVDADHPDCFGDIAEVRMAFAQFVENCPLAVVRAEDELICKGAHLCIAADGKACAGGEGECSRVGVCAYETHPSLECEGAQTVTLTLSGERACFTLPFPGEHYAEDAAFAVALAHSLGVGVREAAQSLSTFRGVARRFERAGEICGAEAVFDYAHHPTEIACALAAAEGGGRRVLVVFQPHTYSRTAAYITDFARVLGASDEVVLLPVFAARERAAAGGTTADLEREIGRVSPKCRVYSAVSLDDALSFVKMRAKEYDRVMFLGAGDIYDIKDRLREV